MRGENPVSFPVLVVPHHGPFIQYDPAADPTSAISLRWTGHEVTQDLKAILDLDNADSVGDVTSTGNTAFRALSNLAVAALKQLALPVHNQRIHANNGGRFQQDKYEVGRKPRRPSCPTQYKLDPERNESRGQSQRK